MKKTPFRIITGIITFVCVLTSTAVYAQPYGVGLYNENVPYGDETSLSIATDGDVSIPITPTTDGVLATGSSNITVTSTDVTGYKLYIRALSDTNMNNLGDLLPSSANGSPAPLATNTWGYNTDASSNFVGISLSDVLIRSVNSPVPTGEITTVTYGIKLDLAKPAGNYLADIIYTAVPQTN
jgi:hypothetical protein